MCSDNEEKGVVVQMIDGKDKQYGIWLENMRVDGIYYECSNCGNVERYQSQFCRTCGKEMHNEEVNDVKTCVHSLL